MPGAPTDAPQLGLEAAKDEPLGPSWIELSKICREIFGRDVSPSDDFFKLGGSSFSVALLITKLRLLNLDIPMITVFETSNLGELSEQIDAIRLEQLHQRS